MAPTDLQHRRAHNLLLISKLLNQRDGPSPFTLVLDSLEQTGKPLLAEYLRRATTAKSQTIFVAFETLRPPKNVDVFIKAWSQRQQEWHQQVVELTKPAPGRQRKLLVIDSLNKLSSLVSTDLPALLSTLINPTTSLFALYHTDVALPNGTLLSDPYLPSSLTLLKFFATTIFTTHATHHVLARKAARDRSVVEPSFGLESGVEGVLQGIGANHPNGLVLEMEFRRRSGRGVKEWYFLPAIVSGPPSSGRSKETIILLEDHPEYPSEPVSANDKDDDRGASFNLGLTEKQRIDREGVVLPYLDAQKGEVEGGRILYDIGSEDDFDEDEDEI